MKTLGQPNPLMRGGREIIQPHRGEAAGGITHLIGHDHRVASQEGSAGMDDVGNGTFEPRFFGAKQRLPKSAKHPGRICQVQEDGPMQYLRMGPTPLVKASHPASVSMGDCHGHAHWALGLCVTRSGQGSFQLLAGRFFELPLPRAADFASPRAWSQTLLGIDEYLRRFSGDRGAGQIRDAFTTRLMQSFADTATEGWRWFEKSVTDANAKLPYLLLLSGRSRRSEHMLDTGLVCTCTG